MARNRPLLAWQKELFPPDDPVAEVIACLRNWPDDELFRAGHAISNELLRRLRPIPVAWPVAQAAYQASAEVPLS